MLVIAATERELVGIEGVTCGIGPVDAAIATARLLVEHHPTAVLNVGLAGGRKFDHPQVVLGSEARYSDSHSRLVVHKAHPDNALLAAARAVLPSAVVSPIATTARVNGSVECPIEAMEGFAVLRACELAAVPALELRVTCNEIAEADRSQWRIDEALDLLGRTLPRLLEALRA